MEVFDEVVVTRFVSDEETLHEMCADLDLREAQIQFADITPACVQPRAPTHSFAGSQRRLTSGYSRYSSRAGLLATSFCSRRTGLTRRGCAPTTAGKASALRRQT